MRRREWDRNTDPAAMLRAVSFPPGALPPDHRAAVLRRLRVFTLTAARPVLDRVNHPACHDAAAVGWRVAEGVASAAEVAGADERLRAAWEEGMDATRPHLVAPAELWALPRLVNVLALLLTEPDGAARQLVVPLSLVHPGDPVPLLTPEEALGCCGLLREVFGDRGAVPAAVGWGPAWQTSTVLALGRQMYEAGDFSPMPVLADALREAGCESPDVLAHCRGPGPHVRGCWVVDLVLDKGSPDAGPGPAADPSLDAGRGR